MMKYNIAGMTLAAFALVVMHAPIANAQTPDAPAVTTQSAMETPSSHNYENMLATLQVLMAKVEELQAQLAKVTGQVAQLLGDDIQQGVSNDDVKTVQELLATDPEIYPEGYTTGYFGPLTKKAIERFQEKHNLTVTGKVDRETKDLMEAFLESDDDQDEDHVSEGLLRRSDIAKEARQKGCEKSHTLCLETMMDDDSDSQSMMDDPSDDMPGMMDDSSDDESDMMSESKKEKSSKSDDESDDESDSDDDSDNDASDDDSDDDASTTAPTTGGTTTPPATSTPTTPVTSPTGGGVTPTVPPVGAPAVI